MEAAYGVVRRADPATPGKLRRAARELHRSRPKDAEFAALGLSRADFAHDDAVEIWPDCELSFRVYDAISGQWRMGPGGPVALDNCAIEPTLRMAGIRVPDEQWPWVYADIKTMEAEALRTIHESNKQ